MIDPLKFDSREEFESKYADLQKSGGVEEVSELHKAILPYFFRRMKSDVEKNLPKREETLIEVQLTTAQKQSDKHTTHHTSQSREEQSIRNANSTQLNSSLLFSFLFNFLNCLDIIVPFLRTILSFFVVLIRRLSITLRCN